MQYKYYQFYDHNRLQVSLLVLTIELKNKWATIEAHRAKGVKIDAANSQKYYKL